MGQEKPKVSKTQPKNNKTSSDSFNKKMDMNSFRSPKERVKVTKASFREKKRSYRIQKKSYQGLRRIKGTDAKLLQNAKSAKKVVQKERKVAKKDFQSAKKNDSARVANIVKANAKANLQSQLRSKVKEGVSQESAFEEGAKLYDTVQDVRYKTQATKNTMIVTKRASVNVARRSYGAVNRTYNLARGNGFVRTPDELALRRAMQKRYRNAVNRLNAATERKKAQAVQSVVSSFKNIGQFLTKPLVAMASNPASWVMVSVIGLLLFIIIGAAAISVKPAILQSDSDLTDSWTKLTKEDADNSDDGNSFYTPLDDVMFWFNYKFEGKAMTDKQASGYWTALNGIAPDFKTSNITELEQKIGNVFTLDSGSYEELQDGKKNFGYGTLDGQLKFPYATEDLVITKRYGYEVLKDKTVLHNSIDTPLAQGTAIIAPMSGAVGIDGSKLVITSVDNLEKITLTGVALGRFKGGETVTEKALLGLATGTNLNIQLQKRDDEKDEWYDVNPAFYFSQVTYTQFTTMASDDFKPNSTMAENAKAIYDYLTKLGYKKEGIAAALGCWQVESSINPKRAEGDYLNPPVGASGNCWDDPAWLAMGGPAIYDGGYSNILHRGLGLGQWTDTSDGGQRHTLLLNYAKSKNEKWYDLSLQLDFMLNGDAPASRTIFKNVLSGGYGSNVDQCTSAFLSYWEGNPGDKIAERVQAAQNWYTYFSQNNNTGSGNISSSIPPEYVGKLKNPAPDVKCWQGGYPGNAYAGGQCTWYLYNREAQLGHQIDAYLGNGGQWGANAAAKGYKTSNKPAVGDMCSMAPGVNGSSSEYGHVAFVEYVNSDGSFLVSEMNVKGLYEISYRVIKGSGGCTFINPIK